MTDKNCNECNDSTFNGVVTICCYGLPFPVGESDLIKEKNYRSPSCPKDKDEKDD